MDVGESLERAGHSNLNCVNSLAMALNNEVFRVCPEPAFRKPA